MKREITIRLLWIAAGLGILLLGFAPVNCGVPWPVVTQRTLSRIEQCIQSYQVATGHYPLMKAAGNNRFETKGRWLQCLLGTNPDDIHAHSEYLKALPARNGRDGIIEGKTGDDIQFVDHWGHPFVVMFSADQQTIANPDAKNASSRVRSGATATLSKPFVVMSLGPDGIEGTHDDIVSWRRGIPSLEDDFRQAGRVALGLVVLAVLFTACWQFFRLVQTAFVKVVWRVRHEM